jgi:hypothetical protein
MKVRVVLLHPHILGGGLAYTYHLTRALKAAGLDAEINRMGNRTAKTKKVFHGEEEYQVIDREELLASDDFILISNSGRDGEDAISFALAKGRQCAFVIHDHLSLNQGRGDYLEFVEPRQVVAIRETTQKRVPGSTLILHPYQRWFSKDAPPLPEGMRKVHAVCRARIANYKNIPMILEANAMLPSGYQVQLHGKEDRFWIHHGLKKKFPNYEMGKSGFPSFQGSAETLANSAWFDVDLTLFPGEAGTQYTMLEAMDARCMIVLHSEWLAKMSHKPKCYGVATPEELARVMLEGSYVSAWADENERYLNEVHNPMRIGLQWKELIDELSNS